MLCLLPAYLLLTTQYAIAAGVINFFEPTVPPLPCPGPLRVPGGLGFSLFARFLADKHSSQLLWIYL